MNSMVGKQEGISFSRIVADRPQERRASENTMAVVPYGFQSLLEPKRSIERHQVIIGSSTLTYGLLRTREASRRETSQSAETPLPEATYGPLVPALTKREHAFILRAFVARGLLDWASGYSAATKEGIIHVYQCEKTKLDTAEFLVPEKLLITAPRPPTPPIQWARQSRRMPKGSGRKTGTVISLGTFSVDTSGSIFNTTPAKLTQSILVGLAATLISRNQLFLEVLLAFVGLRAVLQIVRRGREGLSDAISDFVVTLVLLAVAAGVLLVIQYSLAFGTNVTDAGFRLATGIFIALYAWGIYGDACDISPIAKNVIDGLRARFEPPSKRGC